MPLNPNSFVPPIVVDGEIVGRWRRVNGRAGVTIDAKLEDGALHRLARAQHDALEAEIARCEAFYGAIGQPLAGAMF